MKLDELESAMGEINQRARTREDEQDVADLDAKERKQRSQRRIN